MSGIGNLSVENMSTENLSVGPSWLWVSYSIISPTFHRDTILSSFQDSHRCWWGWTGEQNSRKPCLLTCPPMIWEDAGREYSGNLWRRHTQETLQVCRNLSYKAKIYVSCVRTVYVTSHFYLTHPFSSPQEVDLNPCSFTSNALFIALT